MVLRTGRTHKPRAPVTRDNDWTVVIETRYSFPGKVNVFWNNRFVPPRGRRDEVVVGAPAGTNHFDPSTRVLSFVLKGARLGY